MWALQWCTQGPSSADSPGSPVYQTHIGQSQLNHTNFPHFILKWTLTDVLFFWRLCVLPVCPAAAHHGWGTGKSWRPARVPALAAGGGTLQPCSELPRPGPASHRSSHPASSPPLSHARCSYHCIERKRGRIVRMITGMYVFIRIYSAMGLKLVWYKMSQNGFNRYAFKVKQNFLLSFFFG